MNSLLATILIGILSSSPSATLLPEARQAIPSKEPAGDTYFLTMTDDHFGIGVPPYEADFDYDEDGLLAYSKATDGGNLTMYTVSLNSYVRPDVGNTTPPEEIDVVVLTEHAGAGGGCSAIHYFNELNIYTTLLEQCGPGSHIFRLSMRVNFKYRFETNAQAYADPGGTTEYLSEMTFLLPPAYDVPPGQTLVSFDGFESGDTSRWSAKVSP